jgi:hypothetical protein
MKKIILVILGIILSLSLFPQQGYTANKEPTSKQLKKHVSPSKPTGSITSKPKQPEKFTCSQSGGCNCWGNSDCNNLVQSGKCRGPLKCDPVNPNACHCD